MKGSSVWLNWHYTYAGDGSHFKGNVKSYYNEQLITFTSASDRSVQVVARRIGYNGAITLQSSIPAPFNGRVGVISSNNTLVIHRLQYTDSLFKYSSTINMSLDVGVGLNINLLPLKPTVSITINGRKIL